MSAWPLIRPLLTVTYSPAISAVLLAAGASRRMGTPKALLPFRGEPLVCHVARTLLAGGAGEVIAVVAPGDSGKGITAALAGIAGVRTVVNPNPERGMLSSVQTGVLVAANADALLVCPCDLPQLQQRQVAAVLEEYGSNGASAESIVAPVPVSGGKRGHPTLFGAANFPHILALDPEAFGLNEVLKRRANQVVEVMVSGEGVLRDADTPDEWRALTAETKRDAKQGTTGP